jgi:hypothetical protein
MVHCWRAVKNAPKWRLGYEVYKEQHQERGANVAVTLFGKEDALGKNALPSWPIGHKVTKANLKHDALWLP